MGPRVSHDSRPVDDAPVVNGGGRGAGARPARTPTASALRAERAKGRPGSDGHPPFAPVHAEDSRHRDAWPGAAAAGKLDGETATDDATDRGASSQENIRREHDVFLSAMWE